MSVDLTLTEFRAFIERINAQSMYELDHLMRESTDFEYAYKHFLACQGKSVRSWALYSATAACMGAASVSVWVSVGLSWCVFVGDYATEVFGSQWQSVIEELTTALR